MAGRGCAVGGRGHWALGEGERSRGRETGGGGRGGATGLGAGRALDWDCRTPRHSGVSPLIGAVRCRLRLGAGWQAGCDGGWTGV